MMEGEEMTQVQDGAAVVLPAQQGDLRAGEGKGFPRNGKCTFLQRGLQCHKSCFSQVTLNPDSQEARTPTSAGTPNCLQPLVYFGEGQVFIPAVLRRLGRAGTVRARWLPQPPQAEEPRGCHPTCPPLNFPTTKWLVCFRSRLFPRDTHRGVLDPRSGCSTGSRTAPRLPRHLSPHPLCPTAQKISWGKDLGSSRFLEAPLRALFPSFLQLPDLSQ